MPDGHIASAQLPDPVRHNGVVGTWNGIELDDVIIIGDQLTLRPWQAQDAPALVPAFAARSMHEFVVLPDPVHAAGRARVDDAISGRRAGTPAPGWVAR